MYPQYRVSGIGDTYQKWGGGNYFILKCRVCPHWAGGLERGLPSIFSGAAPFTLLRTALGFDFCFGFFPVTAAGHHNLLQRDKQKHQKACDDLAPPG